MSGVWLLSLRRLLHHRMQAVILVVCIAVSVAIPMTTRRIIESYRRDLTARAEATPLVAGSRGNRFDLTLSSLYFRSSELDPITWSFVEDLRGAFPTCVAVPLHMRFTARGLPVVGTDPDYYALRRLHASSGSLPTVIGEAVLGANAAAVLELGSGDSLYSDQRTLYDLAAPVAVRLDVCGVLAPTGGPDDDAIFVDIRTSWMMEGLLHGHVDADALAGDHVLGRSAGVVLVNPSLVEHNQITSENVASFHMHGDQGAAPLTSIIIVPDSAKSATMLKSRVNASRGERVVVPVDVVDDLMAAVFRIRTIFDVVSGILASSTLLLVILVLLLSARIRRREMETLEHIGCSRGTVATLYVTEVLIVLAVSVVVAIVTSATAAALIPNLVRSL